MGNVKIFLRWAAPAIAPSPWGEGYPWLTARTGAGVVKRKEGERLGLAHAYADIGPTARTGGDRPS